MALTAYVYIKHKKFDHCDSKLLFSIFNEMNNIYVPMKFNHCEPINKTYNPKELEMAIDMLSTWGSIFLKRDKPRYLISIKTGGSETKRWSFHMSKDYYKNTQQYSSFIELMKRLFKSFSPIYAIVSLESDHYEKHNITEPDTGRDLGTRGYKWFSGEGLPGIYWINFFGGPLVEHFGKERLLNLECADSFVIEKNCIVVQAYSSPMEKDGKWRRSRERKIVNDLGADYFFDNEYYSRVKRPKRRKPIPGIKFN